MNDGDVFDDGVHPDVLRTRLAEIEEELRHRAKEGLLLQFYADEARNTIRTRELEAERDSIRRKLGPVSEGIESADRTGRADSGRESAERRLAVIYAELTALVQPAGTLNDAPLARSEELEIEAAGLRERWSLADPRGTGPVPSRRAGIYVLVVTVLVLVAITGIGVFLPT